MTTRRTSTRKPRSPGLRTSAPAPLELVRLPRVRTAQRRIATGWYDRDDVKDSLARAVLAALRRD